MSQPRNMALIWFNSRAKIATLWAPGKGPVLAGPDCWEADLTPSYYNTVLTATTPTHALHAVTFHDYGDDCSGDVTAALGQVLNVSCLDAFINASQWVVDLAHPFGVPVWNGESALHSSSGIDGLTNTFVSSLWYAYELAAYASGGVGLLSRQTLVGGDYELVNKTTFTPHPDYYIALLWKRLVGSQVLSASLSPSASGSPVRAFAQCAFGDGSASAGVVAILVNFASNASVPVSIDWGTGDDALAATVEVYQLTPLDGSGSGSARTGGGSAPVRPTDWYRVALNGQPLNFVNGGPVPATPPVLAPASQQIILGPATVTLVVNAAAGASVCSGL